ncbi:MAG: penicillin-binding transpeptidase domain-containing protein [Gammaproteobacteria bacterium]|nr:penicillin-binding transpeptidase domain-containing protein [Gammaproteobacteria bacterium]
MNAATPIAVRPARRRVVLALLALAATVLVWRAVDLHIVHKEFLRDQGAARYLRVVTLPAHRGMITDRNGEPLAVSTPVESVWANPRELATARADWPRLAALLDLDTPRLADYLATRLEREFVYLKRRIDPDLAARVMALNVPGVALTREYRRYYPEGEVTAHVLGITGVDDNGQEGIELAYDDWLDGVPGAKRVIKDRLGRIVQDVESLALPRPGRELRLSIDRRIQYLAYRELKSAVLEHQAQAGSVVVLDATTGEVLAMVNIPAYNPNRTSEAHNSRYRNRAVTDLFEPGSTVKPFTVAAALESGQYRSDTMIDTAPGLLRIGSREINDIHDYGRIDVATVIQKSSNIGAAKMALAIPREKLWQTFSHAGFGAVTGSGFPGEAGGVLTYYPHWHEVDRASLAFGYGLSVTTLQLAEAYATIANGGQLHPASFLPLKAPVNSSTVMQADTAATLRAMLESVTNEGGTGLLARVAGYRVAGKTGTVRKLGPAGYAKDRYLSLFAGFAPASHPRLVMVVMINEPGGTQYYGGQVAAPVFAHVMAGALRLLNVAPDDIAVPSQPQTLQLTQNTHGAGLQKVSATSLSPDTGDAE